MKGEVRQMPAVTFISLVFRCFQADESLSLLSIAGIFFNFLKTQAKISGDLEKTEKQAVRCLRSVLSFGRLLQTS